MLPHTGLFSPKKSARATRNRPEADDTAARTSPPAKPHATSKNCETRRKPKTGWRQKKPQRPKAYDA